MALNKLTPEELQRLRADLVESLEAAKQAEVEKEIHETVKEARSERYKGWTPAPPKIFSSGLMQGSSIYRLGQDFDPADFKIFAGDTPFKVRYEEADGKREFLMLIIDGNSYLQPGDFVVKTAQGEFFTGNSRY